MEAFTFRRTAYSVLMIWALRSLFAVATFAVIVLLGYYLVERDQAQRAATASVDASRDALRHGRKEPQKVSRQVIDEACTRLRADFEVWEHYLDKRTKKKLKNLIAECHERGETQVSADP